MSFGLTGNSSLEDALVLNEVSRIHANHIKQGFALGNGTRTT